MVQLREIAQECRWTSRVATRLGSERDRGVRQAFSNRVMIQRKAVIGALHLVYWLAKEVAHTTKFNSLKEVNNQ